jgi:phage baseplate assembly protein V
MTDWNGYDRDQRIAARVRNSLAAVTLQLPDDTKSVQKYQTEGLVSEIRDNVQVVQLHGFSSLPLPGARGIVVYPSGNRGNGLVIATIDPRYRPTGLRPGEASLHMVDGAKKDGTGGTTRTVLSALLGWATSLFGKNINVGDSSNTVNITITGSGAIKLAGNVEITGTLKVDGATTVQDISIQGNETGGGST